MANRGRVQRKLTILAVLLASLALGLVAIRWAAYRYTHVVSTDASLKSFVSYVGVRVQGKIAEIMVEDGQTVSKGQVIARLEDRAFQAAVYRAKSDLDRAIREVESTRLGIEYDRCTLAFLVSKSGANKRAADASVNVAEANAVFRKQEFIRANRLLDRNWLAMEELNMRTADHNSAQAAVRNAKAMAELADFEQRTSQNQLEALQTRVAGLKVLEAQVEVTKGVLQMAEADLEATTVVAPEDGQVVRRIVDAGGSVRIGYPIIVLRLTRRVWVEAWIDEASLSEICVGSPAEVTLDAIPGRVFMGRVAAIGALTNTELQGAVVPLSLGQLIRPPTMVDLRIELTEADDNRLVPGLTALAGVIKARPGSPSNSLTAQRDATRTIVTSTAGDYSTIKPADMGLTVTNPPTSQLP